MLATAMLAAPHRLRTRAEFDRVFKDGRSAHGALLSIRVADAKRLRAGFTVGKSVSQKAVDRNRVRRRLREIIRGFELDAVELVISAKPAAAKATTAELRSDLETLLKKRGAFR